MTEKRWTPERKQQLRDLWHQGHSYLDIANDLNNNSGWVGTEFTRSMIAGKCRLFKLRRPADWQGRVQPSTKGGRPKKEVIRRPIMVSRPPQIPDVEVRPVTVSAIECLNLPFMEVKGGQCRTIVSNVRFNQKCCGLPVKQIGSPYCAAHYSLFYRPYVKRGRPPKLKAA